MKENDEEIEELGRKEVKTGRGSRAVKGVKKMGWGEWKALSRWRFLR